MFGSIDANCEIAPIVESAYNAARDICEYHYMSAPELDFKTVNGVPGDETPAQKIKFVYVPAHLYHILFELIKNSMRATIERHGEATVYLPPIKSKLVFLGVFTCLKLARLETILVSIVVILLSIEPILVKCVHLQV